MPSTLRPTRCSGVRGGTGRRADDRHHRRRVVQVLLPEDRPDADQHGEPAGQRQLVPAAPVVDHLRGPVVDPPERRPPVVRARARAAARAPAACSGARRRRRAAAARRRGWFVEPEISVLIGSPGRRWGGRACVGGAAGRGRGRPPPSRPAPPVRQERGRGQHGVEAGDDRQWSCELGRQLLVAQQQEHRGGVGGVDERRRADRVPEGLTPQPDQVGAEDDRPDAEQASP